MHAMHNQSQISQILCILEFEKNKLNDTANVHKFTFYFIVRLLE